MATNKLQWKRIAKGDKLPCQSFLRKKDGEILKLSTGAGVTVGQDAYYLPVDEVIEEIKNYPIKENEDEKIKQELIEYHKAQAFLDGKTNNKHVKFVAWLEKQGEPKEINPSEFDSQLNILLKKFESLPKEELAGILNFYLNVVRNDGTYKEEKQGEQKPAEWSEEDEENFARVDYACLKTYGGDSYSSGWLRKFLGIHKKWKPSDKQMNALEHYMNTLVCNEHKEILFGLYADLKKLKE